MIWNNNTKLRWVEDDDCFVDSIVYSLKDVTDKDNIIELAWFFFDTNLNKWVVHFILKNDITKYYREYNKDDVEQVKFRVMLDLQSEFNKIGNMAFSYSDCIADMVTKYLEKELNKNENK